MLAKFVTHVWECRNAYAIIIIISVMVFFPYAGVWTIPMIFFHNFRSYPISSSIPNSSRFSSTTFFYDFFGLPRGLLQSMCISCTLPKQPPSFISFFAWPNHCNLFLRILDDKSFNPPLIKISWLDIASFHFIPQSYILLFCDRSPSVCFPPSSLPSKFSNHITSKLTLYMLHAPHFCTSVAMCLFFKGFPFLSIFSKQ